MNNNNRINRKYHILILYFNILNFNIKSTLIIKNNNNL